MNYEWREKILQSLFRIKKLCFKLIFIVIISVIEDKELRREKSFWD